MTSTKVTTMNNKQAFPLFAAAIVALIGPALGSAATYSGSGYLDFNDATQLIPIGPNGQLEPQLQHDRFGLLDPTY